MCPLFVTFADLLGLHRSYSRRDRGTRSSGSLVGCSCTSPGRLLSLA